MLQRVSVAVDPARKVKWSVTEGRVTSGTRSAALKALRMHAPSTLSPEGPSVTNAFLGDSRLGSASGTPACAAASGVVVSRFGDEPSMQRSCSAPAHVVDHVLRPA